MVKEGVTDWSPLPPLPDLVFLIVVPGEKGRAFGENLEYFFTGKSGLPV